MLADLEAPARPAPPKPAPKPAAPAADVLDLTEAMAAPRHRATDARSGAELPHHRRRLRRRVHRPPPDPEPATGARWKRRGAPSRSRPLPSVRCSLQRRRAAVDSAFNTLAQTVLVHNARTLEDLVKEMLRPMLKSWLDDNLPGLVERIVRAEIERVSRGRP